MSCLAGEYNGHDESITINLAKIESIPEYVSVECHEILHWYFDEHSGEETSEEQDHFIIKKMLWGSL